MTDKPKIAIVVCAFPPQGGGIGNNADYHATELNKRGFDVAVFTPDFKNIVKQNRNYPLIYLPVFMEIGKAGFMFGLIKRLDKYDIIHLYYPFFGTDILIWFYKLFHPQKKLIIHYQMDPIGRGLKKIIFWLHIKLIFPLLVRQSDKIIALSNDHARHSYLKKYLSKVVAIANGIDTSIFKPADKDKDLANKLKIEATDKVVVFAGGLDKQHYFKGVDILLQAMKKIDAKLLILGDGNLRKKYENMAVDLGIKEKIIFAGWIENKDLPDYYRLGDVFVLPSTARTESFGIVIAEAQACGLPAVVSNWPGSRKTIKDTKTGLLVKPGDADELTNKINIILENDQLAKKMSVMAFDRAGKLYGWNKVIEKIIDVYKTL